MIDLRISVRALQLRIADLSRQQRQQMLVELAQVQGFMPLLMKQRNGERWSMDDRRAIREQMAGMVRLSPYVIIIVMPGGLLLLPVMAWWLDRRRIKRDEISAALLGSEQGHSDIEVRCFDETLTAPLEVQKTS